jgi:hypothetical protein
MSSTNLAKCTDISDKLAASIIRVENYSCSVMMGTNYPEAVNVWSISNLASIAQFTTARHWTPPTAG